MTLSIDQEPESASAVSGRSSMPAAVSVVAVASSMGWSWWTSLASQVSSAATTRLVQGGDRLGVVALHGAVAGVQEAAVGVGDVGGRVGVGGLLRPTLEGARQPALGGGCRGVGRDALLVGLLPGGGLGLQLGLACRRRASRPALLASASGSSSPRASPKR